MKFRIGALALDRAGIENLITGLEQRHVGSDRVDDPGGIVSENLGFTFRGGGALAHLVVDLIGCNRLHGDPDIPPLRLGFWGFEIDQRVRLIDGKRLFVSDGFHARGLLCDGAIVIRLGSDNQNRGSGSRFDAFSSREPVPTPDQVLGSLSLENALALIVAVARYWQVR